MSKQTENNVKKELEAKAKTAEAQRILREEQQKKVNACQFEISNVLTKHNCALVASMIVTQQGNIPRIEIVPQREQQIDKQK